MNEVSLLPRIQTHKIVTQFMDMLHKMSAPSRLSDRALINDRHMIIIVLIHRIFSNTFKYEYIRVRPNFLRPDYASLHK